MTHKKTHHKGRFNPWNLDHLINEVLNTNLGDIVTNNADFVQKTPPINVVESAEYFKLEMAVPGLSKKDVAIKVDGDTLTLSADTAHEISESEKWRLKQFSFGKFKRTYKIPKTVDLKQIKAHMSHGILSITMHKKAKEAPINVEIS